MSLTTFATSFFYLFLLCVGQVKKTVYLVGKGITYDTGGADIKAGGHMAGMSRYEVGSGSSLVRVVLSIWAWWSR